MLNNRLTTLPRINADLLLLHPPAYFDFRERRDIYFPFLSTSGDVPITPLYEYFPLGFKSLKRYLSDRGYGVKIINLASVLLRYPRLDIDSVVEAFDAQLIGIDLHWMVHVQGSLAIAKRLKEIQPDLPVIFGGISATYYADQIIRYPFIDMVMRGYDTHEPMAILLEALKKTSNLELVPNLMWKSHNGQIRDNIFTYKPRSYGYGIDWSDQPEETSTKTLPIRECISTQIAGCSRNCGWCGGSQQAFCRVYKLNRTVALKSLKEVKFEFGSLNKIPGVDNYHLYNVGSYNESRKRMNLLFDQVGKSNLKSVSYEQFQLTPEDIMKCMVKANKCTFITLSPESHDLKVAKLAGRGVYTNKELEEWIYKAFDIGIYGIDIWYFVGMPEQDENSVLKTVEYCHRLLELFKGKRVNPMICPMIPYLDPASTFFEYPEKNGYRIFYRTVEEHRLGMERSSVINRINYETKWLSRSDLIHVGYRAVRELMRAKADFSFLPSAWVNDYITRIDDALDFIDVVHEVDCLVEDQERLKELDRLGDEILKRNNMIFFSGVMNQSFPINRNIGGRWFDEMGWTVNDLDAVQ